jgi:dipeptidyl aminopeptidase/acylaminoacyl peptidase
MKHLDERAGSLRALLTLWLSLAWVSAGASQPPAEAFGRTPAFSRIAMSPDGRSIAIDQVTDDGSAIVILDIGQKQPRRVIEIDPEQKLRDVAWASNQYLLIDVSAAVNLAGPPSTRATREIWRTMAVRVDSGSPQWMLGDDRRGTLTGARVLAAIPERKALTMSAWDFAETRYRRAIGSNLADPRRDSGWVSTLFDVDIDTGKGRVVERGTPYTLAWLVNAEGRAIARSEWRSGTSEFTVLARPRSRWRRIFRSHNPGLSLSGTTSDGKAIVGISGYEDSDFTRAWKIPVDGSPPSVLFELPASDVTDAISDPYTGIVVGFRSGGAIPAPHWIDAALDQQQWTLDKAFPGRQVNVLQRSKDGRRALVSAESPSHPPVCYLVDFDAATADLVGEAYPELAGVRMGEMEVIEYVTRDEVLLPAYLTVPPGAQAEHLPLVVMPHGGPEARDAFGFDWWSQFLATRGYAVLRPQFRGSTGFGRAHRTAGYRQWGKRMQDDVTDGVRYLIARGIADPERICIVGASYGGYAALAGAALTPDLYACAASVNGVADLPSMLGHEHSRGGDHSNTLAYWKQHIGPATDPQLARVSPARAADQIRVPVLLMHGVEDTVVPISQSESMAEALQEAGKAYALVRLPGEDHWLSRDQTRTLVLKELETFLGPHLRPDPPSIAQPTAVP